MVRKEDGITLIELMIVMAIVGLLVAVAVPKYGNLLEKANLGATMGNLSSLRSAVSIYYGTYMSLPTSLDPEECAEMRDVINGDMPYVKAKYPPASPPYGNNVTTGSGLPTETGTGWYYNTAKGDVRINSTALSIKAVSYSYY